MAKSTTLICAVLLAVAVGIALFLCPKPTAREELQGPASIPPAARQVIRTKMNRHDAQMRTLISRVVLLDEDGIARAAGEIFDQPSLARPLAGDELNGLLPEKFYVLQDELRARARQLVVATQEHNHAAVAEASGRSPRAASAATKPTSTKPPLGRRQEIIHELARPSQRL